MVNNTKIKVTTSVNNYKNIKIIEKKYRSFINKNYLFFIQRFFFDDGFN